MNFQKFKEQLSEGVFDEVLKTIYGSCEQTTSRQKQRYAGAVDSGTGKKIIPTNMICKEHAYDL